MIWTASRSVIPRQGFLPARSAICRGIPSSGSPAPSVRPAPRALRRSLAVRAGSGRSIACTRWRCQRRTVSGVTRRCPRSAWGSRRIRAANTARSAQPRRGLGLVRRSTATSCRKMSSSTSLVEDVRPISRTSPSTCGRSDRASAATRRRSCQPSKTADHRWSATRGPSSGKPTPRPELSQDPVESPRTADE
jgi:hypothetical protein